MPPRPFFPVSTAFERPRCSPSARSSTSTLCLYTQCSYALIRRNVHVVSASNAMPSPRRFRVSGTGLKRNADHHRLPHGMPDDPTTRTSDGPRRERRAADPGPLLLQVESVASTRSRASPDPAARSRTASWAGTSCDMTRRAGKPSSTPGRHPRSRPFVHTDDLDALILFRAARNFIHPGSPTTGSTARRTCSSSRCGAAPRSSVFPTARSADRGGDLLIPPSNPVAVAPRRGSSFSPEATETSTAPASNVVVR